MSAAPSDYELPIDGINPEIEEDFLTACFMVGPGRAKFLHVRPLDLKTQSLRWLFEAMLEQGSPESGEVGSYDVDLLARSLQRRGMGYAEAVALVAKLWSRDPGNPDELVKLVIRMAFRRSCIAAAAELAKATTRAEAKAAVAGVI